jgi:hypothetical protein
VPARSAGRVTISPADLAESLGVPVRPVEPSASALAAALLGR